MSRCYVSPSLQTSNEYAGGTTTEAIQMRAIGEMVVSGLNRCKIENKISSSSMSLAQAIADSNAYFQGVPNEQCCHVAIHSNAGGGQGTEVWIYATGGNAERLAKCVYGFVAPVSPGTDRGVKVNPSFMELNGTDAPAVIIETEFHDYTTGAQFIINHHLELAEAIVKGVCQYFGVAYVPTTPPASTVDYAKQIADLQAQLEAEKAKNTTFVQWADLTKKLLGL